MSINFKRSTILSGVLVLVIFFIVWINHTKNQSPGVSKSSPSLDSMITVFNRTPEGKYEMMVAREQVNAYYSGNKELYTGITGYFEQRAKKEGNKVAQAFIYSNKGSVYLAENKPDSALLMGKQAEQLLEGTENVGLGNVYNIIANSYYYQGKMDSAKSFMTKGFVFATTHKFDAFITTFGINLGTINYEKMLFGAASHYFTTALEAAKREQNVPLMLINNITTILSVQGKYAEADSLWNIYLGQMLASKDSYERQLFFLNHVLHQQNMGRLKESRVIYSEYKPEDVYEVLRVQYVHAMLNQSLYDNKDQAVAFFKQYKHWIGMRYPLALTEMFADLSELVEYNPTLLPMDTLQKWEKKFASDLIFDPKARSHANILKSIIARKQGNMALAYQFLEKSRLDEVAFNSLNDSLRYADFAEKNELSRLKEEVSLAHLQVEETERNRRYTNYFWLLSLLVLIGFIVALLFALSYRKTKLKYALEQINFMKTEENYLMKEQELNTRIVNLSQLIVLKAQDLGKKIKLVASEDKEALQEVKREIEELSRLGIEEKPQLADKLLDDHQAIFNRFPEFAETGNLTEKRIFILSIDGYKPKEIANVVGVSIQYVHNVRTRLRKKLNIDNTVEWESLKKDKIN